MALVLDRSDDVEVSCAGMPLEPEFVRDCPYGPEGLLIDEILTVDREASLVRVRLPTDGDLPITNAQRNHPERHPAHVAGGLMVHLTGMVGFVHAYYVLDLRHAEGWIGYGVRIHDARFKALADLGEPLILQGQATRIRTIRGQRFVRYRFVFTQEDKVVYEGDQTAAWHQVEAAKPPAR